MKTPRPSQSIVWNPGDYAANSASQLVWARELMAQLDLQGSEHVLDVGCGDGKVTAELARAVPRGSVTGMDASAEMIAFAKKTFPLDRNPNLKFQIADVRKMGGGNATSCFDLVFSNATLHWVDDHRAFLRGAAGCLRSGGRLVVSSGGKGNAHDVFLAVRAEIRLKRWRNFFRGLEKPYFFHSPEDYKKWLPKSGFRTHHVRLTPKDAVHNGRRGFAAWVRTTWLPYTQRVPEAAREEFIAAITDRYITRHPPDKAGHIHVRMVRLEIDAVKI